jgi:phosphate:Na+ symporter
MWPLAQRLTRWLQQRFRAREEDEGQPQFLDDTVLAVPTLALDALTREVTRAGQVALRMTRSALAGADAAKLKADHTILMSLDAAIARFVERLRSASMSQVASARLAELLRIQRYHEVSAEQAMAAGKLPLLVAADTRLASSVVAFVEATSSLLLQVDPTEPVNVVVLDTHLRTMEARYQDLKADLLAGGADARLALTEMEQALRRCSALRRAAQQLHKSRRRPTEGVSPSD